MQRHGVIREQVMLYDNGAITSTASDVVENTLGKKRYELSNHLGNVLSTISDRKIWNSTDSHYEAVVTMYADYYAGGMLMPGRNGGQLGRYLFNGMEHDGELSGDGNSYTTEYRQYDPRLMRWKSLDPLMSMFPHISPYVAFANNPIVYTDPYGLAPEGGPEDPPTGGLPSNPKDQQVATGDDGKNYQWLEGAGWARDYGDPVEIKQTWWQKMKTIGRIAIKETESFLRKADEFLQGDGDRSGFIQNGAPLVNPGADGSQQGSAIKKTKRKEPPIDVEWFTKTKGWKVKIPTWTTPKDQASNLRKIYENVEKVQKEVEKLTEGNSPALDKVDDGDVINQGDGKSQNQSNGAKSEAKTIIQDPGGSYMYENGSWYSRIEVFKDSTYFPIESNKVPDDIKSKLK